MRRRAMREIGGRIKFKKLWIKSIIKIKKEKVKEVNAYAMIYNGESKKCSIVIIYIYIYIYVLVLMCQLFKII